MVKQPSVIPQRPKLVLPTEKSTPKGKVSDYKWLIYGAPGIGKTTLSNQFDTPLILDFEGRTKHLECYSLPIGTFQEVRDVYNALKEDGHPYKTVVFDTVDLFYRLAVGEVCSRRGIEHPSDEPHGKGYDMVKTLLYPVISSFQALGLGLVFTSHLKEEEIKISREQPYTKFSPSLAKSPSVIFLGMCDIIGYCHFDADMPARRVITFKGGPSLDAKKSTSEFVTLPDECEMSFSVIKSYFKGEE